MALVLVALAGSIGSRSLPAAETAVFAPTSTIFFGIDTATPLRPWAPDGGGYAHHPVDATTQALTHGLHFAHPLVTETPTPDSKLRVDYFHTRVNQSGAKARIHTLSAEIEMSWRNLISLSVSVPYVFSEVKLAPRHSHFDNTEIALKFANYALADQNLVYGGGIEIALPTGDDSQGIGSDHIVSHAPFLDVGYEQGNLQSILFVTF
ncbi:MAG TPA: hypothetical protein VL860_08685, partial [Planctomycetota bacterium]|nr:hypothetical protein [Planctomycetota bacterium]